MANRQNPTANSGLTDREKWSLEAKAKQGWKCYFIERHYHWGFEQRKLTAQSC